MHYLQFHASWVRTHTKQEDTTARKRRQSMNVHYERMNELQMSFR